MDQTAIRTDSAPLAAFVDELRAHERFQAFARTLPTRARTRTVETCGHEPSPEAAASYRRGIRRAERG